jgi:uncharacterized protein Usg
VGILVCMIEMYTHNSIIQSSILTTLSYNPVYPQLYHSSLHRTMAIQYTHNSIIVANIEQWQSSIPTTLSYNPVYPQLYHTTQYTHNSIMQTSIPTTLSYNPVYPQLYHTIQYTHNSLDCMIELWVYWIAIVLCKLL